MPGEKAPPRTSRPAASASPSRRAFRYPAAVGLFAALTAAATAADLWSKQAVFDALLARPGLADRVARLRAHYGPDLPTDRLLRGLGLHREVFPGFRLTLSTNPGVVFGLPMPAWAVAAATVATMGLVVFFFAASDGRARWVHTALALILAGAAGNFYDRMVARVAVPGAPGAICGQVRDFLDFSQLRVGGLSYPYIFNLADVFLVVGVAMVMLHWWAAALRERRAARAGRSDAGR